MTGAELMQLARLKRQEENEGHMIGLKKVINSENIFVTKDNPKGYFRPETFIQNILELPQSYEEDFKVLFNVVSANEKLEKRSSYQYQVRDTGFKAFEITYGPYNFRETFRLVLIDGMDTLLKAVKTNAFSFDLNFDDLIKKAHELKASH
ncbi:hypothetical protein [Sphingobacterium athyrii]|nr:hypothetical protein [Sphingobacterium athyrii]